MFPLITICLLALLGSQLCLTNPTSPPTKLDVAIYYEYYCPDSQSFLLEQFKNVYKTFSDDLNVLFVPFGKAESDTDGKTFYCQHGPAECTMNRLESCGLDILAGQQDAQVDFVLCHMSWSVPLKQCANKTNVSPDDLRTCEAGTKGIELQLEAEKQTHRIARPYPRFIPTIVFNQVFDSAKQRNSLNNFKGAVCAELSAIYGPTNAAIQAKCS